MIALKKMKFQLKMLLPTSHHHSNATNYKILPPPSGSISVITDPLREDDRTERSSNIGSQLPGVPPAPARLPQRVVAVFTLYRGRGGQWRGLWLRLEDLQLSVPTGVGGLQTELEHCPSVRGSVCQPVSGC